MAHALVVFLLWAPAAQAVDLCKLYSYFVPTRRLASETKYHEAKTFWEDAFKGRKKISRKLVLGKLREKGDGSPETLMALWDTLNPDATVTFSGWMEKLGAAGIDVQFRKADDVEKPTDQHRLRWKWTLSKSLTPLSRKPHRLEIRAPESVPETEEDLFTRMYTLSVGLPSALLDVTGHKSPMLSSPVGDAPYSYPKQLRDAVEAVERRVYDTMKHWEDRWHVKPPVDIDKWGPGAWTGGYWTMPIALGFRMIWPFYKPTRRYRPSQRGYGKYKEGQGHEAPGESPLTKWIRDQYQVAGTTKWTSDQYLRYLKVMWAYGLGNAAYQAFQWWRDGYFQAAQQAAQIATDGLDDPELNDRLKAYQEREGGDPVVNDFFGKEIAAIEEKIKANGDPDGSLKKQIDKLIEDRDFFKN